MRYRRVLLVIGTAAAMALAACGRAADPVRTGVTTPVPAQSTPAPSADPGGGTPTVVDDQLGELENSLDQIESELREDESSAENE